MRLPESSARGSLGFGGELGSRCSWATACRRRVPYHSHLCPPRSPTRVLLCPCPSARARGEGSRDEGSYQTPGGPAFPPRGAGPRVPWVRAVHQLTHCLPSTGPLGHLLVCWPLPHPEILLPRSPAPSTHLDKPSGSKKMMSAHAPPAPAPSHGVFPDSLRAPHELTCPLDHMPLPVTHVLSGFLACGESLSARK